MTTPETNTPDLKASYLTSPEAARILGITYVGVAQLIRQGKIPAEKVANRWLIPRPFLEEFAQTYSGRRGRPRKKYKPIAPVGIETAGTPTAETVPGPLGATQVEETREATEQDFTVSVTIDHVDGNYDFEVYKKGEVTEHARLIVARLRPRIPSLPHFSFRWDYRYDHLNVDILGVGVTERDWFRGGHLGYSGHIPRRLDDPPNTFEVSIWMPGTHVFRGRMRFALRKYAETTEKESTPVSTIGERLRKWRSVIGRKRD